MDTSEAARGADPVPLELLVQGAVDGDQAAWNEIVDRFAALVWSVCRLFRLGETDAADVAQTVWLRTIEHLPTLREPRALPGWLSTTTRRECLRLLRQRQRLAPPSDEDVFDRLPDDDQPELDEQILAAERRSALREAFTVLPPHCQQLLTLLVTDDRPSYAEIGSRLAMPVGSIGPTRSRCLGKLRDHPALRAYDPRAELDPDPSGDDHA